MQDASADILINLRRGQGELVASIYRVNGTRNGSTLWTVPPYIEPGPGYYIEIGRIAEPGMADRSDGTFTLAPGTGPFVDIVRPVSGVRFDIGGQVTAQWTSSQVAGNVSIRLLYGIAVGEDVTSSTANDGSFTWTLPGNLEPRTDYYVAVRSVNDPSIFDTSARFTVSYPGTDPVGAVAYDGESWDVEVALPFAYVANLDRGLRSVDVSNPAAPQIVGRSDTNGNTRDVELAAGRGYTAVYPSAASVYTLPADGAVLPLATVQTPGDAYAVAVSGNFLYVADGPAGLHVYDASNPSSPTPIGAWAPPTGSECVGVTLTGTWAYVSCLEAGLFVLNVSVPASPVQIGRYDSAGETWDVAFSGSLALVADGTGGLLLLNANAPLPTYVGNAAYVDEVYDVATDGQFAYAASNFYGLQVYDIGDPANPVRVGFYYTPGYTYAVSLAGGLVYLTDRDDGLYVVRKVGADSSPPAAPAGLQARSAGGFVRLTWNASPEPDLSAYVVHRATGDGPLVARRSVQAGQTAFPDTDVEVGTRYRYAVSAVDRAGNEGPLSSTVSVTVTAATPVEVAFFNIPFGPSVNGGAAVASGLLGTGSPAKICADGSASTRIRIRSGLVTAETVGALQVELVGVPSADVARYLGSLSAPVFEADVNGAELIYTHPRLVRNDGQSFRAGLRVRLDGLLLGEDYPVDVYRAPVILVHGLWSNAGSFDQMEDALQVGNRWPDELRYRMNYQRTNAASFSENVRRLDTILYLHLVRAVAAGYSAGRTDYVGHSMGGLLARLHIQRTVYAGSNRQINRLVTVNTPHAGSQVANLITGSNFAQAVLTASLHPTYLGAVDDLRVNSDAVLQDLNGEGQRNRNVVPSHAVVTRFVDFDSPSPDEFSWDRALFVIAQEVLQSESGSAAEAALYGEFSDLIVPLSSQYGGFAPGSASTTFLTGQAHIGSQGNSSVISTVVGLLGSDTEGPDSRFTHEGFNPPTLIYDAAPPASPVARTSGSAVTITSPLPGATVVPGETVTVTAAGTGDVNRLLLTAGSPTAGLFAARRAGASASFTYTVPQGAFGPLTFAVAGLDGSSFGVDSVRVNVEPSSALVALFAYPETVTATVGEPSPLSLTGRFADGVDRDVMGAPGLSYSVADPGVASVNSDGEVVGVSEGATMVTAAYRGQTVTVGALVLPPPPPVATDPPADAEADAEPELLPAYPNPSAQMVTIPFVLSRSQRVTLRVYDLLGRQIAVPLLDAETSVGTHRERLATNWLPSGIYLVRLSADGRVRTGRFSVAR